MTFVRTYDIIRMNLLKEAALRGLGDEMEAAVTRRLTEKEKAQLICLLKKLIEEK